MEPSDGHTDTTSLLRLLNDEVGRLKSSERSLQESKEKTERESQRTLVLLQLTHDQLSLLKEANTRLQTELLDARTAAAVERRTALEKKDEAERAARVLLDATERHKEDKGKLETELTLAQQAVRAQQTANGIVLRQVEELQEKLARQQEASEAERRAAFEIKTAMEVRLRQTSSDLQEMEALRSKETKESIAREYELSKTISALKAKLERSTEDAVRESKAQFSLITSLRAEVEDGRLRCSRQQKEWDDIKREQVEVIARLRLESAMYRERLDESAAAHRAREKVLEGQVAKFCADLRSAQAEINEMASKLSAQQKDSVEALIAVNARLDASKLRAQDLEGEVDALKEKLRATIVQSSMSVDQLRGELLTQIKQQQEVINNKNQAIQHLTMDLRVANASVESLKDELHQHRELSESTTASQAAEILSQRVEIEGYRNAVRKLEGHIENNYDVRILTEQNASLGREVESLKEKLRHANHTLANMRVEADISDTYRVKMMQEHLESELQRIAALEKERRAARGLLRNLADFTKKVPSGESLGLEIEAFAKSFGNLA